MAVNPLERVGQVADKLAQAKAGRRGLLGGTAGGALALALDRVRPVFADHPSFEVSSRQLVEGPTHIERELRAGQMLVVKGTVSRFEACGGTAVYEPLNKDNLFVYGEVANRDNMRVDVTLHPQSLVIVEIVEGTGEDYDTRADQVADVVKAGVKQLFDEVDGATVIRGVANIRVDTLGGPPCEEVDDWFFNRKMRMAKPESPPAPARAAQEPIPVAQPAAPRAEAPRPAEVAQPTEVRWFSQNNFTSKDAEIPFGDRALWSYMQVWDGKNLNSVVHVAVAPGVVLRVNRGWVGSQWHLSARDDMRWEEMRKEVQARDKVLPDLVVVESAGPLDPRLANRGFTVQSFPKV